MRPFLLTFTFAGAVTLTLTAAPIPSQHTHDQRAHDQRAHDPRTHDQRSHAVMGFDQHKTVHRFSLFEDGGAIEVSVKDPADSANLDAIRSHLPHIAERFGAGQFEAPAEVHARQVPGTAEMARMKDRLRFKYTATPRGGRVDIVTSDRDALDAVHAFLKFQIEDHKTGDPIRVTKRPA